MMRTIGTYTVAVPYMYTYAGYETASAYDRYEIQAGTYELTTDGYYGIARVSARHTYHHYVSSLMGHSRLSADTGERDEMTTHAFRWYLYEVAEKVLTGSPEFTLADDLYAASVTFTTFDGRELHTTGIFERATDNKIERGV